MPRKLSLGVAALVLAATACVPPVPDNDEVVEFDPVLTSMGRVQEEGVLRVGIPEDAGPFATGSGDEARGFTVELGKEVAGSLGVDVDFRSGTDEELGAMVDSGTLDLAFPLQPITEKAITKNAFTDPYWIARERVLSFDGGVEEVADLAGKTVCQSIDDITGIPVERLQPDAGKVTEAADLAACPEVDAMVGPDIRLLAQMAPGDALPALVGEEINAVGYGAMTALEDKIFADYVSTQFSEARTEGRWSAWFGDFISPVTGETPPDPPGMHLEEAAALYPLDE